MTLRISARRAWPVLAAAVLVGACSIEPDSPPLFAMTPDEASPAVWRVSDADSSIFLFGTIHQLPPDIPWQTPSVFAAFALSELLVTESNAWFGDSWSSARIIRLEGLYPAGQSLRESLRPGTRDRLLEVGEAYGLDLETLDSMRPWLAAWSIGGLSTDSLGMEPQYGVESVLYAIAAEFEMPQDRLERAPGVLKAFASLSDSSQEAMLVAALDDVVRESDGSYFFRLIDAWLRGDPDMIDGLANSSHLAQQPAYHDVLIVNRNRAWLDQLEGYLSDDVRAFVAVGAAHLAGPDGVDVLLEDRGYAVERIDPAGSLPPD